MNIIELTVEINNGERIDKYLSQDENLCMTRNSIQKLIDSSNIIVNNKIVDKKYKVKINDKIIVNIPDAVSPDITAENIPLDIVYEDNDLLVVNKPKGMVVHPAPGNYSGTLVNALMYHCGNSLSGINGVIRQGIVHRIDKNTSGLLIVAKNDISHKHLANQIKEHSFKRKYQAVVYGNLKDDEGTIDAPIGRHPVDRKKMAITYKNSKPAITHYKVLERYDGFTHIELILETGRTHQIRVHMSSIGHSVAGDDVYGVKKVITSLQGQCLHAYYIGFVHPVTNKWLEFSAPLPEYFTDFLSKLRKQENI